MRGDCPIASCSSYPVIRVKAGLTDTMIPCASVTKMPFKSMAEDAGRHFQLGLIAFPAP